MKIYTKLLSISVIAAIIIAVSGCSDGTRKITDMQQRQVKIPAQTDKVICLSPGIAELFYEFGIQDKLAGRSYFCLLPEQIQSIPQVGAVFDIDTNTLLSLNPDLVIASTLLHPQFLEFFQRHEIPIVIFQDNKKFEEIYAATELFGKIFNMDDKAKEINAKTKEKFQSIDMSQTQNKPTVFFAIGFFPKSETTINDNTLIGNILNIAGYRNIAAQSKEMSISLDELTAKDPDYIIIPENNYEKFVTAPQHHSLSAVKNGKTFMIKPQLLNALSVSNLDAIKYMEEIKK
ncbi:MAG: ABC transporter substrate-binding protein [Bacteroidales bacterium]|nr:ABC transporter substrate-binding protein [Bacteroidales bacterium]